MTNYSPDSYTRALNAAFSMSILGLIPTALGVMTLAGNVVSTEAPPRVEIFGSELEFTWDLSLLTLIAGIVVTGMGRYAMRSIGKHRDTVLGK